MINTTKENALTLIIENRLQKISSESQQAEFRLYLRNHPLKNISFDDLARSYLNAAEFSGISQKDIQDIIDEVQQSFTNIKPQLTNIRIDQYIDNVTQFYDYQPFFYDKQEIFWFWNDSQKKYEFVDETDLMIKLDSILGLEGQTVTSGVKRNYIEAFKRVGRIRQPQESKKQWVQFKDKAFSLNSGNIY